jgi:hypothetical protein
MGSKGRQLSFSVAFKVEVMNSAEKQGNRTAERRFGSPPAEKVIRELRDQMVYIIKTDNSRK